MKTSEKKLKDYKTDTDQMILDLGWKHDQDTNRYIFSAPAPPNCNDCESMTWRLTYGLGWGPNNRNPIFIEKRTSGGFFGLDINKIVFDGKSRYVSDAMAQRMELKTLMVQLNIVKT